MKKELYQLGEELGIEVIDKLSEYDAIKNKREILPYSFAKEKKLIAFDDSEDVVKVALNNPFDLDSLEEIKHFTGKLVKEFLASQDVIDEAIEICYGGNYNIDSLEEDDDKTLVTDLLDDSGSGIIALLNAILLEAIRRGASDIHFEPLKEGVLCKYRIDGVIIEKGKISHKSYGVLSSRVKVLSKLDISEKRLPQDGKMVLHVGEREVDFRVSSLPVIFGERMVLRILDKKKNVSSLEDLGIDQETLIGIKKLLTTPKGLILVTGPTGSGKTTTLYSILQYLKSDRVNVITIEDPVEYKLDGMAQMNVNEKISLNFQKGLKHILRQDPDIIMVGEIRDRETAEIAVQASLTGHLVLSTLHTNDALAVVVRLIDMGIEPYLLSASLNGVIAQRLVRTLCSNCKVKSEQGGWSAAGCEECFGMGYQGRAGIYQLMVVNKKIRVAISSGDSDALEKASLEEGFKDLRDIAMEFLRSGRTTMEEVTRNFGK